MLLRAILRRRPEQSPLLRATLLPWGPSQQQQQQVRWLRPGFPRGRPRPPKASVIPADGKSEWWVVDGEMHEIGDGVPHRERFVIPRDNLPNRRRKQMREQFMRRTRLVLKESIISVVSEPSPGSGVIAPTVSTRSRDLQQEVDAIRQNQEAMAATLQSVSDQQSRTSEEVRELFSTLRSDCGSDPAGQAALSEIHHSFSTTTPLATRYPSFLL